jgi:hypothetical protein
MNKEERIKILKDAKTLLLSNRLSLSRGLFIDVSPYITSLTKCEVCLRGLLFCTIVDRQHENVLAKFDVDDTIFARDNTKTNRILEKVFTKKELILIENVFELYQMSGTERTEYIDTFIKLRDVFSIYNFESKSQYQDFLNQYAICIIDYMIKNKGHFVEVGHFLKSLYATKFYRTLIKPHLKE